MLAELLNIINMKFIMRRNLFLMDGLCHSNIRVSCLLKIRRMNR